VQAEFLVGVRARVECDLEPFGDDNGEKEGCVERRGDISRSYHEELGFLLDNRSRANRKGLVVAYRAHVARRGT
jgi:hypothetical protein